MNERADSSETPHVVDPRLGRVLEDRYRIVRVIGRGGMGTVYEGEHLLIKRRVAIKCLHPDLASNPNSVERFRREALAAASIGHPHIIDVTDMGRFDDGTVFMVLEFLQGRPWSKDLAEGGALPVDKVVRVVGQICDGLGAAHEKGIVHRDLKPENIFLIKWKDETDFVKILDFGIAKILDDTPGTRGITKTGSVIGTPHYMAPEQLEGRKDIDRRVDIYSTGVILFQSLTAQLPFTSTSLPLLIVDICREPPPPLDHYRPDLPEGLVSLVGSMLSKSPADRPASCAAVAEALAHFAGIDAVPVVNAAPWKRPSEIPEAMMETGPTVSAESDSEAQKSAPATVPEVPTPRLPFRLALASLLVIVLAGLAVGLLYGTVRDRATEPEDDHGAASERPSRETTKTRSVEEQTFVSLEVRTDPTDAELILDGRPVTNPYTTELPTSAEFHRLEARAPDHETVVEEFVLTKARLIEITLPSRSEKAGGSRSQGSKVGVARPRRENPPTTEDGTATSRDAGPDRTSPAPEQVEAPEPPVKSQPAEPVEPVQEPGKRLQFKKIDL